MKNKIYVEGDTQTNLIFSQEEGALTSVNCETVGKFLPCGHQHTNTEATRACSHHAERVDKAPVREELKQGQCQLCGHKGHWESALP